MSRAAPSALPALLLLLPPVRRGAVRLAALNRRFHLLGEPGEFTASFRQLASFRVLGPATGITTLAFVPSGSRRWGCVCVAWAGPCPSTLLAAFVVPNLAGQSARERRKWKSPGGTVPGPSGMEAERSAWRSRGERNVGR